MWLLVFPAWIVGMMLIGLIVSPFQSDKSVADQAQIAGPCGGHELFDSPISWEFRWELPFFEEFLFRGLLA